MASTKDVEVSRADVNEILTFAEAIAASNLSQADVTVVVNPYEVVNKNKDVLLNNPFFIRKVVFKADESTGQTYCVFYCVTQNDKLYVVTDGSTGIHEQLVGIVDKYGRDHSFLIANGLRKSTYKIKEGENAGQEATTYYLA